MAGEGEDEEVNVDSEAERSPHSVAQTASTPMSTHTGQHVAMPVTPLQSYAVATVPLAASAAYSAGLQAAYAVGQAPTVAFYPQHFGTAIASPNYAHPIALPQAFFTFQGQLSSPQLQQAAAAQQAALTFGFTRADTSANQPDRSSPAALSQDSSSKDSSQSSGDQRVSSQPDRGRPGESRASFQPQALKRRYSDVFDLDKQLEMINRRDADGDT